MDLSKECEEMYGEVVDRRRHLPHIVMDHGREARGESCQYDTLVSKYQGGGQRRGQRESSEESYQHVGGGERGGRGGRGEEKVNFTDIPDIVSDVRQIPVIIINNFTTTSNTSSDDELEDYYENHKEWPASFR